MAIICELWYKHATVAVIKIYLRTVNNGHWINDGVIVYLFFLWCLHCYFTVIQWPFQFMRVHHLCWHIEGETKGPDDILKWNLFYENV